jgi:hypothetical protein
VFRKYGELFPEKATNIDRADHNRPQLFTAFLSARSKVVKARPSLGFSIDLGVLVPDYEVDGTLWLKNHYAGGYIFRDKINLEAIPPDSDSGQWRLRYGFDSNTPNRATREAEGTMLPQTASGTASGGRIEFRIPIVQSKRPGIDAVLVLTARPWNLQA